jgi:hypothetical protein
MDDDLRSTFSLRDKSGLFHERISSESAALFSKMINPDNVVTEVPDLSRKKRPIALETDSVTGRTVVNASSSPRFINSQSQFNLSPKQTTSSPRIHGGNGNGDGVDSYYGGNGKVVDSTAENGNGSGNGSNNESGNGDVRPIGRNMSFFKRLVSERSAATPYNPSPRQAVEELPMMSSSEEDYMRQQHQLEDHGGNGGDEVIADNASELTSISRKNRKQKRKEEREFYEKKEYLLDLEKYTRLGFEVQRFTLDDPLIKIQYEWERHTLMIQSLERVETIKMWIRGGVMIVYGISYIFTNKLDGWMVAVNNEIDNPRYIPAFEEIYREQFQRNPPNPKMQLLWMLLSTAALTIVANLTSSDRQTIGNYGKHAITVAPASTSGGQVINNNNMPGNNNIPGNNTNTVPQSQAQAQAQNPLAGLGGLANMFGGGGMGSILSMAGKILPMVLGGGGGGGSGGAGGGAGGFGSGLAQMMGGLAGGGSSGGFGGFGGGNSVGGGGNSFVSASRAPIIPPQ